MPEGVILGGWSYVIAAYAIVGLGLSAYAVSLIVRNRRVRAQSRHQRTNP